MNIMNSSITLVLGVVVATSYCYPPACQGPAGPRPLGGAACLTTTNNNNDNSSNINIINTNIHNNSNISNNDNITSNSSSTSNSNSSGWQYLSKAT